MNSAGAMLQQTRRHLVSQAIFFLSGNREQGSYKGIVDFRGRPNLEGVVVMMRGVFRGWSYEGEWRNGQITGRGTFTRYIGLSFVRVESLR